MNKEELDLLEIVFTLAIGECAYNDINNIQKLEDKIKTINNLCKKQKEVIEKIKTRYCDYYGTTKEVNDDYVLRSVLKEISDLLKEVE